MIPKYFFWIVCLFILLIPFSKNWKLLAFGDYTKGEVINEKILISASEFLKDTGSTTCAVIRYRANNKNYTIDGPIDLRYPIGKKLPVIFNPKNPHDHMILNVKNIYLGEQVIIPFVLLVIWFSLFFAIRQSRTNNLT